MKKGLSYLLIFAMLLVVSPTASDTSAAKKPRPEEAETMLILNLKKEPPYDVRRLSLFFYMWRFKKMKSI